MENIQFIIANVRGKIKSLVQISVDRSVQIRHCRGRALPLAPPGEELSAKLTEVECGEKSHDVCAITDLLLYPTFRHSTSDLASLGHLLPGRRYAPSALKSAINRNYCSIRCLCRSGCIPFSSVRNSSPISAIIISYTRSEISVVFRPCSSSAGTTPTRCTST